MNYMASKSFGWLLWHEALAEALIADLRALGPSDANEWRIGRVEDVLVEVRAEIDRRHQIVGMVEGLVLTRA